MRTRTKAQLTAMLAYSKTRLAKRESRYSFYHARDYTLARQDIVLVFWHDTRYEIGKQLSKMNQEES